MRLAPNTVDRPAGGAPFLDIVDHTGCLGVGCGVDVVFVDVELGVRVSSPGSLEGDADVVFSEDLNGCQEICFAVVDAELTL